MNIITEKMVAGGSCIARIDGKAVFIPFSLPGETLAIEIIDSKKDFSFAKIVSVIEASPHRIQPVCPLFGQCGGCTLQMADSVYQRQLRLSILQDIFNRAHIEPENKIRMISDNDFGYRSRFQFHRTSSGNCGLKEGSSNEVIAISDCPVAVPEIRNALKDGSIAQFTRHMNSGDRFHVFGYKGSLWHEDGVTSCSVPILDKVVNFDVRGFFQSNIPMLEQMISEVCKILPVSPGKRMLDFYSGVGTFSVFAGRHFEENVLVEHNKEALEVARENLTERSDTTLFCAVSDDKWPLNKAASLDYDTAIVDPPRQGISQKALSWFIDSSISDLRYVSCDPATFARDARTLIAGGYRFTDAVLVDFYPQTHHIETLGLFTR